MYHGGRLPDILLPATQKSASFCKSTAKRCKFFSSQSDKLTFSASFKELE